MEVMLKTIVIEGSRARLMVNGVVLGHGVGCGKDALSWFLESLG